MKKGFFLTIAFLMCFPVFSQESEKANKKSTNEIKWNLFMTFQKFPEISYEKVWENNFSAGLTAGFLYKGDEGLYRFTPSRLNFLFAPYGRYNFGKNPKKTFFIEASISLMGVKITEYYSNPSEDEYNWKYRTSPVFGLGIAAGYKFIIRHGFIGEFFIGYGTSVDKSYSYNYPRMGISIGKQF